MNTLPYNAYPLLLRNDLPTFIHRAYLELHPNGEYLPNWHLDLIADRLIGVMEGRIKRLIINVPPRSLKSICVSVAYVAYLLGHHPGKRIICASYGQELADKHARDTRQVMQSPWYKQIFNSRLRSDRMAIADLQTTEQGGRLASSVGGALTGRGGDLLIVDDPVKPDEALSKTQREAANDWFDSTLYTRLNSKRDGAIIVVMQRLHLDDLVGHVQQKEFWDVLSLPAIASEDESWAYTTLRGRLRKVRKTGEALHPAREPLDALKTVRETLGEYSFSAQYQQTPVPLGGGLIKLDWLRYLEPSQIPAQFATVLQSWDTANKADELADYSVCTTWGVEDKNIYLMNVYRKRVNYPDLKRAVHQQAALFSPSIILVEDKASGTQLLQELLQERLYQVKGVKPEGDKIMRMHAQTAAIENGFVYLPNSAPWLGDFVHELTSFPHTNFYDQVDSTAQALAWISEAGREPAIITFYREELEKLKREIP